MPVYSTIGIVFFEVLLAAISVVAFAILTREYAMRRTRPLLFYCLAFLAEACAVISMFGGQVLAANGYDQIAVDSMKISAAFAALGGLFFAIAFLHRYKNGMRWVLATLVVALPVFSVYALATLKPVVAQAGGTVFIGYSTWELLVIYAPLCAAFLPGA